MKKIYLSSTYEDLKQQREAVYRTLRQLRLDVVSMEDYVASGQPPLDKCLADVVACDAYIGLFAWRYGFVPEGHQQSITELELREAERCGLPCLVFLLADDVSWPPELSDSDRRAISALREHLRQRFMVQHFRSVDQLAGLVATSVANLYAPSDAAEPTAEDIGFYRSCIGRVSGELHGDVRIYALACASLVAVALGALTWALAAVDDSMQRMFFAGGGFVSLSTSPIPFMTMRATRRKTVVLEGYADALAKERPARDAVLAVRRFVEGQLATAGAL